MQNTFLKQADANFKKGKSALKTGVFKWSKDIQGAAMYFSEAVKQYKLAQVYDKAIITYELLIPVNEQLLDNWAVAQNYEGILLIYFDNGFPKDTKKIRFCLEQAGNQYKLADSMRNMMTLYLKAAQYFFNKNDFEDAAEIMKIGILEISDDAVYCQLKDFIMFYVKILIEQKNYQGIIEAYRNLVEKKQEGKYNFSVCQQQMSIILLYLFLNDISGAEDALNEAINTSDEFIKSSECDIADKAINFFKAGDKDKFDQLIKNPTLLAINPISLIKVFQKIEIIELDKIDEKMKQNEDYQKKQQQLLADKIL